MLIETGFETELADLVAEKPKEFGFKKKSDWIVGFGGSISAGVTLKDGKVYFGCADHHLYCVDAKSGKEVWRFRANDVNDTSRPFIHEGIVYAGFFDGYMYALGERGGQMIWKFKTGDRITGTANGLGGLLVFGSWDGYIYGVNRKNGKEIWNFNTGERVAGSATVDGKRIYIGSRNGNLYCLDSEGKEVWRFKTGGSIFNYHPSPIKDGIMYFGCWDGHVYAVDISNGKEKWRFNMGSTEATPLLYENRLYIGSWDNNFYCIDLNGKEIWRFRANPQSYT